MFLLSQSTHRMLVGYHARIGHLYVPNLRARIPNALGGHYVVTNAEGFRSDVPFARGRSSRRRILFFGDSFTAGDGCENAERFPELIGDALDAEVYNYGVSGTGTDQQLLVYETFARDVVADLIVIGVYVENIERIKVGFREWFDRVTQRRLLVPKPYFTLAGDDLVLHHVPVPLERPPVDAAASDDFQSADPITNPIRDRIISPLERYSPSGWMRPIRRLVRGHVPWMRPALLRWSGFQPHVDYRSATSDGWRLMEAILTRFIQRARPTPVLLVPIPTRYFYHDGIEPLYQPLFERLASADVHVADLTRPLRELPWPDRRRISFSNDPHFSPFGHAQVARVLADTIRSIDGWYNATPAPKVARTKPNGVYVLGLSCFYHDSAACLIKDGEIIAAAEEERFSRVKGDRRFPDRAANYCFEAGGVQPRDLAAVVYYDNAPMTFERLLHTFAAAGAESHDAWRRILPNWLRYKLQIPRLIRERLHYDGLLLHDLHHRSHAASAFFPSPFERAAIITVDGVGEWATGSIGVGNRRNVHLLKETRFPNSLGLLYSAFTQFTGFAVNSGEYKLMGLAPYGTPKYVDLMLREIVDLKEDGSLELNLDYFGFLSQTTMTSDKLADLFGGPPRQREARITHREMDIARSIQAVTEEAMLRMARYAKTLTGESRLCLAGGVALNCVANGRLLREGPFEDIWIQPAAGDAGCALGAALDAYHTYLEHPRQSVHGTRARQQGSCWGPDYSEDEIAAFLTTHGYPHRVLDPGRRADAVAELLEAGQVVGHFAGRMEFGPRSLGSRAILADARNAQMQATLNLKIKYRESFRPFAPSVLAEKVHEYFDLDRESPYMLLVAPVLRDRRRDAPVPAVDDLTAIARQTRSDIPAVTHVDYSARIQTVARVDHPEFYDVIAAFERRTGCALVVNTSFNVRGEPIVCTPDDAYRCFMRTEMDALVLGRYLLLKCEQPDSAEPKGSLETNGERGAPADEEDAMGAALDELFWQEFLPAVAAVDKQQIRLSIGGSGHVESTWADAAAATSAAAFFAIPSALDDAPIDPARAAGAVLSFWSPGAATDALRPVVVKLLALAKRFPGRPEDLDERVSESIYVMS